MGPVPRFVAAALVGVFAALVLVALAAGSERRAAARVTLQIAPRGLGNVSVAPAGLNADNQFVSTCSDNEGSQSCSLAYDRGQSVTMTATGTAGRSLSSWSNPDCTGTTPCTVALDDDFTSIVAVFNPLRLGVRLSNPDAGHVTTDPAGKACAQQPDDGGDQCFEFAPGTSVKVTVVTNPGHKFGGWNPGCEPTNTPTCTVIVTDEPTWIGARFDNDGAPGLPTTITVQFQLKRGGNGRGRVTGTKLDCGTVCTAPVRLRQATRTDGCGRGRVDLRRLERRLLEDADDMHVPRRPNHLDQGELHSRRDPAERSGGLKCVGLDANRHLCALDGIERQRRRDRLSRLPERRQRGRHARNRPRLHGACLRTELRDSGRRGRCGRQSLGEDRDHGEDEAVQACCADRWGGGDADEQGPHAARQAPSEPVDVGATEADGVSRRPSQPGGIESCRARTRCG